MFFSVQMNSFFHYWDRDSGTELVFVWPDQASVPVSQCPSRFGVAMLLGISESLCSSEFRSRYAPRPSVESPSFSPSSVLHQFDSLGRVNLELQPHLPSRILDEVSSIGWDELLPLEGEYLGVPVLVVCGGELEE